MTGSQGGWLTSRYRGSMVWILLVFLLPLPALLEAGHACESGMGRSATSLESRGRHEGGQNPSRFASGCMACKLLRNLSADGSGPAPALAAVPAGSLSLPQAGSSIPGRQPQTPLLPRPPPGNDNGLPV